MRTDFTIKRGQPFLVSFVLRNPINNPINITNYNFMLRIRPSKYNDTPILQWNIISDIIQRDAANGTITIALTGDDTTAMTNFGSGVFNIWFWDVQSTLGYVSYDYSISFEE